MSVPSVTWDEFLTTVKKHGWKWAGSSGSHRRFRHEDGRKTGMAMGSGNRLEGGLLKDIAAKFDIPPEELGIPPANGTRMIKNVAKQSPPQAEGTFGRYLFDARQQLGLSQGSVAGRINNVSVHQTAISKWERGVDLPDAKTIEALSKILPWDHDQALELAGLKVIKTVTQDIASVDLGIGREETPEFAIVERDGAAPEPQASDILPSEPEPAEDKPESQAVTTEPVAQEIPTTTVAAETEPLVAEKLEISVETEPEVTPWTKMVQPPRGVVNPRVMPTLKLDDKLEGEERAMMVVQRVNAYHAGLVNQVMALLREVERQDKEIATLKERFPKYTDAQIERWKRSHEKFQVWRAMATEDD